jgi:hypothetical protein
MSSSYSSPFLLKFARPCNSRKALPKEDPSFYDYRTDMRRVHVGTATPLLVDAPEVRGPVTKKMDIERGEDQKDRRMWR